MTVASIRYNNPGAMWGKGNPIAARWGATKTIGLNDGLKQGNNIAFFPDKVHGAAAQFDLWRTKYTNRTLKAAILRWSGGNWSEPYASFLEIKTGLAMDTMVTASLLASHKGMLLMKYQAQWEAGQPYPLSDAEWLQAQQMVFNHVTNEKVKKVVVGGVATGGVIEAANQVSAVNEWVLLGIVIVAVAGIAYWLYRSWKNV